MVNAVLTISQARTAALAKAGQQPPSPQQMTALIDTGASCTSVDSSVIAALNLQPTGTVMVVTPSTGNKPHQTSQYDAALLIPGPTSQSAPLFFPTIAVIAADLLQPQGFHALIGRDILNRCLLTYNGSLGLFTLAY